MITLQFNTYLTRIWIKKLSFYCFSCADILKRFADTRKL